MLTLRKLQYYCIYLFAFSLNFETVNLFNLGIDYLASKITICILFAVTIFNLSSFKTIKRYSGSIRLLFLFFLYLTIISFINRIGSSISFVYFPFLLNILILLILLSVYKKKPEVILNSIVAFSLGCVVTAILFLVNIGVELSDDGRLTIFGLNQNMLGLNVSFAIFVFLFFILKKKVKNSRKYFLSVALFPLFLLLVKTGSRVAFLSFLIGGILFLFSMKNIGAFKRSLIIFALFFISVFFWFFLLRNSVLTERLISSINEGDLSSRDLIWLDLFDIIMTNYLFGVGITGYEKIVGDGSPHNVLIEVLCYTGIFGLILFISFLIRIGKNAYRFYKLESNILPLAIFIPIMGMILTGQIFEQKIVWILFAFLMSAENEDIPNSQN